MTTEQAIKLLHRLQDSQFDGIHGDERREALEMAVRALESNLVKGSDGLVQDLVKDCISRQVAIDIVDIAKDLSPDAFSKGALKAVRDKLSELPPENTKRKKGKWEKGYFYGDVYRCSVCHEPIEIPYTYCPSCGAFMSPYIGKLQRGEHDG